MSDLEDAVQRPGRGVIAEVDVSGLDDDGDAVQFRFTDSFGQESEGFVMRWGDDFVAYENRCPHWSVPIGYQGDSFLDSTRQHILCPMHGARFEVDTGECFMGPCMGDALEKFDVTVEDGEAAIRRRTSSLGLKLR